MSHPAGSISMMMANYCLVSIQASLWPSYSGLDQTWPKSQCRPNWTDLFTRNIIYWFCSQRLKAFPNGTTFLAESPLSEFFYAFRVKSGAQNGHVRRTFICWKSRGTTLWRVIHRTPHMGSKRIWTEHVELTILTSTNFERCFRLLQTPNFPQDSQMKMFCHLWHSRQHPPRMQMSFSSPILSNFHSPIQTWSLYLSGQASPLLSPFHHRLPFRRQIFPFWSKHLLSQIMLKACTRFFSRAVLLAQRGTPPISLRNSAQRWVQSAKGQCQSLLTTRP